MRLARAFLILPLLAASCAGVPRLTPLPDGGPGSPAKQCGAPFLTKKWRLVHAISGSFPGGGGTTMIGVTEAVPLSGRIRCTLMSIEGLVLCDATHDKVLTIHRGIGPFASPDMVMGMVRDIRLMLFPPAGTPDETGSAAGRLTCRYRSGETVSDVVPLTGGTADVVSYEGGRRARTVKFSRVRGDGLPGRIELEARGVPGYSLILDLIEADPLR